MTKKALCLCIAISLIVAPNPGFSVTAALPEPGAMVHLSPSFEPVLIKGLRVYPQNPFQFDFIVDSGDSGLQNTDAAFQEQSQKLIKYFLAAMTIPEKDLWVNLSPYEQNRMMAPNLGETQMGQDMLAQDYILKQLTASLIYPEGGLGKIFWDKVHAHARELYGATELPINTFNKVWIVADKADIFERNGAAYIVDAHLKVMVEEDYLALALNKNNKSAMSPKGTTTSTISTQTLKEVIIPAIEKEVNSGTNFASLRQMYYSMILASWYKMSLKDALLTKVYGNQSRVKAGVHALSPQEKAKIFERYVQAYKKGVFNYIKEDGSTGASQPRKYFSGGLHIDAASIVRIERGGRVIFKRRGPLSLVTGPVSPVTAPPQEQVAPKQARARRNVYVFIDMRKDFRDSLESHIRLAIERKELEDVELLTAHSKRQAETILENLEKEHRRPLVVIVGESGNRQDKGGKLYQDSNLILLEPGFGQGDVFNKIKGVEMNVPKTIVVIEGDQRQRARLQRIGTRSGYNVIPVSAASDAWQIMESDQRVALIMATLNKQDTHILELLKKIDKDLALRFTPVIVRTERQDLELLRREHPNISEIINLNTPATALRKKIREQLGPGSTDAAMYIGLNSPRTALIVDTRPKARSYFSSMLSKRGKYHVMTAKNIFKAKEIIARTGEAQFAFVLASVQAGGLRLYWDKERNYRVPFFVLNESPHLSEQEAFRGVPFNEDYVTAVGRGYRPADILKIIQDGVFRAPTLPKLPLLIVDDDESRTRGIVNKLVPTYKVFHTTNAMQALEILQQRPIAAVFSGGYSSERFLQEMEAQGLPKVPVVVYGFGSPGLTSMYQEKFHKFSNVESVIADPRNVVSQSRPLLNRLDRAMKVLEHGFQKTILVVEDDDSHQRIMRRWLGRIEGHKVLFARNGAEGLAVLKSAQVDMVITDWDMPDANATVLLDGIKQESGLQHIPVIIRSASKDVHAGVIEGYGFVKSFSDKDEAENLLMEKVRGIFEQADKEQMVRDATSEKNETNILGFAPRFSGQTLDRRIALTKWLAKAHNMVLALVLSLEGEKFTRMRDDLKKVGAPEVFQGAENLQLPEKYLPVVVSFVDQNAPQLLPHLTAYKIYDALEEDYGGVFMSLLDTPENRQRLIDVFAAPTKPEPAHADEAMAGPGGIDLDRAQMRMNVRKQGTGVAMGFDQAMAERIQKQGFDGLEFQIQSIVSITNLPVLFGLDAP